MKRVVIFGSRDFNNFPLLQKKVDFLTQNLGPITILSGKAKGADSLGEKYAHSRDIPVMEFPAEWETYGKRAGMVRNKEMFDNCDYGIAFWDGTSPGTKMMINLFHKYNKPIRIVYF
jgi:hypothetical protein